MTNGGTFFKSLEYIRMTDGLSIEFITFYDLVCSNMSTSSLSVRNNSCILQMSASLMKWVLHAL